MKMRFNHNRSVQPWSYNGRPFQPGEGGPLVRCPRAGRGQLGVHLAGQQVPSSSSTRMVTVVVVVVVVVVVSTSRLFIDFCRQTCLAEVGSQGSRQGFPALMQIN